MGNGKDSSESKLMPCALCLKERELCRSHIIPEFLYKPLYEDDKPKKFFQISADPGEKTISRQQGIWERLLCGECEARLSPLEKYARTVIFGGTVIPVKQLPGKFLMFGVDYTKFKIFQFSLLWRAGVSSRPEFSNVKLGPHQERLREMILSNQPGEPHEYGCMVLASSKLKEREMNLIMALAPAKIQCHHLHQLLLHCTLWWFFVSKHTSQLRHRDLFLSKDGILPVFDDRGICSKIVGNFAGQLREAGKLDALPSGA